MGGPGTPQPGSQQAPGSQLTASNAGSMFQASTPAPMTPLTPASEGSGIVPQLQYVTATYFIARYYRGVLPQIDVLVVLVSSY